MILIYNIYKDEKTICGLYRQELMRTTENGDDIFSVKGTKKIPP
jgi:hypothetical protein